MLYEVITVSLAALARRLRVPMPSWGWRVPAYTVGSLAAFWTIQRTMAFW